MKVPYYLLASALCLAVAIGACSDGPTNVADEADAALTSGDLAKKPDENGKHKVDICHWDADGHDEVAPDDDGDGAWFHISVDARAWSEKTFDGDYDACSTKGNGNKATGHNGHEMDAEWVELLQLDLVADPCVMFCYPDSDDDGWDDNVDNCPDTYNPGQEDDVHPNETGDACDDPDDDGVFDDVDNCPDTKNSGQEDGWGGGANGDEPDGEGDACDDTDSDGTNDDIDTCQLDDTSDDGVNTDGDGWCDSNDNCVDTPNNDQTNTDGDINGDACELCDGDDATGDTDSDGICNDTDPCANDAGNDADSDGWCASGGDCDDTEATVNPGITDEGSPTDYCDDTFDNDCDGDIDLADSDCPAE